MKENSFTHFDLKAGTYSKMNIDDVIERATAKVTADKGAAMKPEVILVHNLTGELFAQLEEVYEINPLAKLDVFYDFRFTECSCKYYVRSTHGSDVCEFTSHKLMTKDKLDVGYINVA